MSPELCLPWLALTAINAQMTDCPARLNDLEMGGVKRPPSALPLVPLVYAYNTNDVR